MALESRLLHPSEKSLTTLAMLVSGFVWLALLCAVLIYGPFVALSLLIAHGLFLANVRGNGVRISATQYPALHEAVLDATRALGLAQPPAAYVLQAGGFLNAFATRFLSRNYLVVFSDLVEHCQTPRQAAFVIGHEVGHLAAGHLTWRVFLLPALAVPWLGTALRRSQEYTCDRCGHAVTGNLEDSKRALGVLAAGRLAHTMDLAAFTAQREEASGFFMTAFEVGSDYPFLCNRVAALDNLEQPNLHRPVARHPLGLILGPFFGGSVGATVLPAIVILGVLAAIAVPNFLRFQQRAQEAVAEAAAAAAPAADPLAADPLAADPLVDDPLAAASDPQLDAELPPLQSLTIRVPFKGSDASKERQLEKLIRLLSEALGDLGDLDEDSCGARECELVFVGLDADAMGAVVQRTLKAHKEIPRGVTERAYGDARPNRTETY